jgi:hypothetical protein
VPSSRPQSGLCRVGRSAALPSGSAAPKGAAFMPFVRENPTHGPSFSFFQQNNFLNLRGDNEKTCLQVFVFPKFLKANSEVARVCCKMKQMKNHLCKFLFFQSF